MLSQKTIQTIKAITPAVESKTESITEMFYSIMFRDNPEVKSFFNQAHQHAGTQPKALAAAVVGYFRNIENLAPLSKEIEIISQKHCSLQIKPEHYPIVGRSLLAAIATVFDKAATEEILGAVHDAYQALADLCIERERQIYESQLGQVGGWSGYREFAVASILEESDCVKSFYLKPSDQGDLPSFRPGQYTSVKIDALGPGVSPRNYSLSNIPEQGYFRISVKREASEGIPLGIVSNFLHSQIKVGDTLKLAPPAGSFFLDPEVVGKAPVVFLAGGIGITPLLSMAKFMADRGFANDTSFFLAARNRSSCAFYSDLRDLAAKNSNFKTHIFFEEGSPSDSKIGPSDFIGRIHREVLSDLSCKDAHFYVCGPKAFMSQILMDLKALDVDLSRVHFEFFGPQEYLV